MLFNLKEELKKSLREILKLKNFTLLLDRVQIEESKSSNFGFLSSNLPFLIASTYKKSLEEVEQLLDIQHSFKHPQILRVEIKKGYINFFPSCELIKEFYIASEKKPKIVSKNSESDRLGERYFIEIVSANPTGELHIGHIRNGIITDTIANLLEYNGDSVYRAYLVNDAGTQIKELLNSLYSLYNNSAQLLSLGSTEGPRYSSESAKECAKEIALKFGRDGNLENKETKELIRSFAVEYFLDVIRKELEELEIKVDSGDYESKLCTEESLATLIKKLQENIYFEEGALGFRTSRYSNEIDKDDVLVKRDGSITYFAQDLIYHLHKLDFLGSGGKIVNVLAEDHSFHIQRLKAFFNCLGIPEESIVYKTTQLTRLLIEGKKEVLSKRKNIYLTLEDLKSYLSLNEIRGLLCSRDKESELDVDLNKLKKRDYNNPIFYILYAYSRASTLVEKVKVNKNSVTLSFKALDTEADLELIYTILSLETQYSKAVEFLKPSILSSYLFSLAQKFHTFYESFSILNDSDTETQFARLSLVKLVLRIYTELLPIFRVNPERLV